MAENIFTPEERKLYEELAQRRGFNTLREYMHALIELDAEQHDETIKLGDEKLSDPKENFRRAWGEAMRGELLSEEEFWKAVSEDE